MPQNNNDDLIKRLQTPYACELPIPEYGSNNAGTSSVNHARHSLAEADIMLSFLTAALGSSKHRQKIDPLPPFSVQSTAPSAAAAGSTPSPQMITTAVSQLEATMSSMPSLNDLRDGHVTFSSLSPHARDLLYWALNTPVRLRYVAVSSNVYSYASEVPPSSHEIGSHHGLALPDYQFQLVGRAVDPGWDAMKARYGSIVAFHGSPLDNWHSILRRGLLNKSGTKEQTSGALYGDGIYFSDDLRVCRGFSTVHISYHIRSEQYHSLVSCPERLIRVCVMWSCV